MAVDEGIDPDAKQRPTAPNRVVTRMTSVIEKTGISVNARKTMAKAWRMMVFTRQRLIGSQVRDSPRSEAMSAANPARLKDSPATAKNKDSPSILWQSYRWIDGGLRLVTQVFDLRGSFPVYFLAWSLTSSPSPEGPRRDNRRRLTGGAGHPTQTGRRFWTRPVRRLCA